MRGQDLSGRTAEFLLQVLLMPAWSKRLRPPPRPAARAALPTVPQVSRASAGGSPGLGCRGAALTRVSPQGESPARLSELQPGDFF